MSVTSVYFQGPGFTTFFNFYAIPAGVKSRLGWPSRSPRVIHQRPSRPQPWRERPIFAFKPWIFLDVGANYWSLWTEAGNLALKVVATGGMFVGGGIAPKIIRKLSSSTFIKAFNAKGRMSHLLQDIPVRVITNDKTALLGAGRVAALALAGKH